MYFYSDNQTIFLLLSEVLCISTLSFMWLSLIFSYLWLSYNLHLLSKVAEYPLGLYWRVKSEVTMNSSPFDSLPVAIAWDSLPGEKKHILYFIYSLICLILSVLFKVYMNHELITVLDTGSKVEICLELAV